MRVSAASEGARLRLFARVDGASIRIIDVLNVAATEVEGMEDELGAEGAQSRTTEMKYEPWVPGRAHPCGS